MLTAELTRTVSPDTDRIYMLLDEQRIDDAINETSQLFAKIDHPDLRNWVQHQLGMFSMVPYYKHGFPDVRFFQWLIGFAPEYLFVENINPETNIHRKYRIEFFLELACELGNSDVIIAIIDQLGTDSRLANSPYLIHSLEHAARGVCTKAVAWLLNEWKHSAAFLNQRAVQSALRAAAYKGSREICDLLLDHGADINFMDERGCTPLDYAWLNRTECPELLTYLRSRNAQHGRELRGEPPVSIQKRPPSLIEHMFQFPTVCDHMQVCANDLLRPDWPIRIHRFDIAGGLMLLTEGMATQPIRSVPSAESPPTIRTELFLCLPIERWNRPAERWPEDFEAQGWVAEWMFALARYLAENNECLDWVNMINTTEIIQSIAPDIPFHTWLLIGNPTDPVRCWTSPEGEKVYLFQAVPLFDRERKFAINKGVPKLLEILNQTEYGLFVHPERPPVV